jgi:hypothetical protein
MLITLLAPCQEVAARHLNLPSPVLVLVLVLVLICPGGSVGG